MRIAFAGPSGTGKSELANWITKTTWTHVPIPRLELNPVGSRSVARDMGFKSPYDADAVGMRTEFQERLLASKIQWESEHEAFVTDRTTIDNLVYAILHGIDGITARYVNDAIAWLDRYDAIFVCPVSVFCSIGDDPMRKASRTYQEIYDRVLASYLVGRKKVLPLTMQNLQVRQKVVERALVQIYKHGFVRDSKAVYDL